MRWILGALAFVLLFMPGIADAASAANDDFGKRIQNMPEVTGIRYSVDGEGKTRIVVDATKGELKFKQSALTSPNRVIVDISEAWLSPKIQKEIDVPGNYIKKIRVAQFDKTTVRVVIETDAQKDSIHIFTLANPERLVMDFGKVEKAALPQPKKTAEEKPKVAPPKEEKKTKPEKTNKEEPQKEQPKPKEEKPEKITTADRRDEDSEQDSQRPADDEIIFDEDENNSDDGDERIAAIIGMKGRVIAIDAGHGGPDSGAIGPTGVTEKSVTLRVATELKKLLEKEGAKVVMTRTSDRAVHAKGGKADAIEELQARCDVANKKKADIFISVHMDAFTNNTAKGTTAYYYEKGAKESKKLADDLRVALIEQINTPDRGTQSCNFYVVRKTDMPAVLVELAFISNDEEEALLDSDEGVKAAAQGLADGIADYFG